MRFNERYVSSGKKPWILPAAAVGAIVGTGILIVICLFAALDSLIRIPEPPQPAFGFTGNWRSTSVFGVEERPLPPSNQVWSDYNSWRPATEHGSRFYVARLGGLFNQTGFRSSTSSGDTPMGAQRYTNVEFIYTDPTNGVYILSWYLRGIHDTSFLRFDDSYRWYELQLFGIEGEYPPRLSIVGIEGIRPEF